MKPMIYLIVLAAVLLVLCPFLNAQEVDDPNLDLMRVREAIRLVENWNGRSIGASGEMGPYQILPSVWAQFSNKSLSYAWGKTPRDIAEQDRVAMEYIKWIDERLVRLHLPRTAKSIGLVFTAGYGNIARGYITRDKKSYAKRVSNMYESLVKP